MCIIINDSLPLETLLHENKIDAIASLLLTFAGSGVGAGFNMSERVLVVGLCDNSIVTLLAAS